MAFPYEFGTLQYTHKNRHFGLFLIISGLFEGFRRLAQAIFADFCGRAVTCRDAVWPYLDPKQA